MSNITYLEDPSIECNSSTHYTLQQVLLILIQKITGHQTHVIFSNIELELNKMYEEFGIDIKSKKAVLKWKTYGGGFWDGHHKTISKKKLVTYPQTDIKFYISIKVQYFSHLDRWDGGAYINNRYIKKTELQNNTNYIDVSMYVPQKRILFSETSMQEVLMEGDLLDMSDDIEELDSKTDSKNKKKGGSDDE